MARLFSPLLYPVDVKNGNKASGRFLQKIGKSAPLAGKLNWTYVRLDGYNTFFNRE